MLNKDLLLLKSFIKYNYNCKYLNNISTDTKVILNDKINFILKNYKNNNFIGYPGLAYIINECINPSPYNNIKYIYTISRITNLYSTEYNMNIYLFGDYHTNKYNCEHIDNTTSVPLFILNQIKTSNDFVDLFIETPLIEKNTDKEILKSGTYIRNLKNKLYDCLFWNKNECIYPHLRAHNIDIRSSSHIHQYFKLMEYLTTMYISFKKLFDNKDNTKNDELINQLKFDFRKFRNYYNIINKNNVFQDKQSIIKYFNNEVYKDTKIEKQLNNIKNENVKFRIKKFFYNILNNYDFEYILQDNINEFFDTYNKSYKKNKQDFKQLWALLNIGGIMETFGTCSAYFMDYYTIARLFRTYKEIPGKYSKRASSIIIYAGEYHTELYKKFLLSLGFNINLDIENKEIYEYKCLNIDSIKQPIFRYKDKQSFDL